MQHVLKTIASSLFVSGLLFANVAQATEPTSKKAPATATVEKVTFTNNLVDGKKVWQPSSSELKAGTEIELTLVNTLADPHGFNLPGFAENVVVNGNETKTMKVTAVKAGTYKYTCQLHPAHVGGELVVK